MNKYELNIYLFYLKMGLLDAVLAPIREVTSSLEKPINLVKKVFGEVVEFTEEVINMIEKMINDIEDLFNASEVEHIFLYPFKEAALKAIGSVEKIYELLKDLIPSASGYKEFILSPLKDAYSIARSSTKNLLDEGKKIIDSIDSKIYSGFSIVRNHFETVGATLETFPSELLTVSETIKRNFEIEVTKLFHVVPEFTGYIKNETDDLTHFVKNSVTTDVESFKNIEEGLKSRIASENSSIDFFIIISVVLFLAIIGGIFYITKSLVAVGALFLILIIAIFIYILSSIATYFLS